MKNYRHLAYVVLLLALASCTHHYTVSNITGTRLLVDSRLDTTPDAQASALISKYSPEVDRLMAPVLGHSAQYMEVDRPESLLGNLVADILMWAAPQYGEKADFAVYNVGGVRAALPEGKVTVGDITEIAPFENKIAFITLKGDKVEELMRQMAQRKGECVSREVCMRITEKGKLVEATVGGQPIDPEKDYRIVTIDYVSHGNDEMTAFKSGTNVRMPDAEEDLSRYVIMRYFQAKEAKGETVSSLLDGRVAVLPEK